VNGKRLACLTSLVVALAAPSAAGAGTIGDGFGPGLAVDAAGTAYIAWSGSGNPASLQFCRLPRGATACDIAHAIVAPGTTTSRAFVVVNGSRVVVIQYRYGATAVTGLYEFISTNGGASFKAGLLVGMLPFYEAVPGPGDTMSGATNANSGGTLFQNVPLDGSGSAVTPSVQLAGVDHPYNGTVGLVDAGTPLAVFTGGADSAQYRRYKGSGSLNEVASWAAPVGLGVARYPKLAGGPSGLFLLASAANSSVFARKWNGTAFGPPVTVATGVGPPSLHAFQDAGGRLHAVFSRGDADGLHLVHAVSDDGKTWRTGFVAMSPAGIADTRVATAPDHVGVAVFRTGGSTGEIRVVAVGPDATTKSKPRITASGSAMRGASTVSVKLSAELVVPSGVSKAAGCKGSVKISIARGETVIASKTVPVASSCKFELESDLAAAKVASANTLSLTFQFSGNDDLTPLEKKGSVRVK